MEKTASEIVQKYSGENVLNLKEIRKGEVNKVYCLETVSSKFIVRMDPPEQI